MLTAVVQHLRARREYYERVARARVALQAGARGGLARRGLAARRAAADTATAAAHAVRPALGLNLTLKKLALSETSHPQGHLTLSHSRVGIYRPSRGGQVACGRGRGRAVAGG